MAQQIKQIDLLVHPFFCYSNKRIRELKKYEHVYGDIEADIMMEIWKASIDEVARDKSRILIFVSHRIKEYKFKKIKKRRFRMMREKDSSYEIKLLRYAHMKLKDRLFFIFNRITKNFLDDISRYYGDMLNPEKVTVNAYGEWTTGCVIGELETLVRYLKIPKKNVHLKPKKSVDAIDGYPRVWEIKELKELPPEIRKEVIRRKVEPYLIERRIFFK